MKKTLFVLSVFAGLAVASDGLTWQDVTFQTSSNTELTTGNDAMSFGGTSTLNSYVFTFSVPTVKSVGGNSLFTVQGTTSDCLGVKLHGTGGTDDAYTLTFSKRATSGTTTYLDESNTLGWDASHTYALTVAVYDDEKQVSSTGTSTYVYLSDLNTQQYISYQLTGSEGIQTALKSGSARAWTNSGNQTIKVGQVASLDGLTEEQVMQVVRTGALIPEPTTATLSLLALAGLAARRRRR